MRVSHFDNTGLTSDVLEQTQKRLDSYRNSIAEALRANDSTAAEYSLAHARTPQLHDTLARVAKRYGKTKHLVLIGIGGSNLGTEAVHSVLTTGAVKLSSLDTISAAALASVREDLRPYKKASDITVCVVSKSGNTAETLVNAGVVLEQLKKQFGQHIYQQTIFIGDPDTEFMKMGAQLGADCIAMPKVVGGRYSVATEVGLVPLTILKHDTDSYIEGFLDAHTAEYESVTADNASRVFHYIENGYRHYNFFAFDPRLATLGAWYRQLFAESLGKNTDLSGQATEKGMLPTISTPVELHSVGQLYLSGFPGVYTDFVSFDDDHIDFAIPKQSLSQAYGRFSMQEVATALYGGVIKAYQEKQLSYRATVFDENLAYSLGLFMGMRMREVMYIAKLLNLNAFDQPNVELYKNKTRAILGL
ncbi:MAG: hypothetical protein AAB388_01595 [Patescibacteria group bacterium]